MEAWEPARPVWIWDGRIMLGDMEQDPDALSDMREAAERLKTAPDETPVKVSTRGTNMQTLRILLAQAGRIRQYKPPSS